MPNAEEAVTVSALTQKGNADTDAGKIDEGIETLRRAVALSAVPMNALAWLYQERKQYNEALPLARLAVC